MAPGKNREGARGRRESGVPKGARWQPKVPIQPLAAPRLQRHPKMATKSATLLRRGRSPRRGRSGANSRAPASLSTTGDRTGALLDNSAAAAPRLQRHPKLATKPATLLRGGRSPGRGRSGANSRAPASLGTTDDRTGALLVNSAAAAPRLQRHPKLVTKLATLLRRGRLPGRGSPERTRGPQLVLERCHR